MAKYLRPKKVCRDEDQNEKQQAAIELQDLVDSMAKYLRRKGVYATLQGFALYTKGACNTNLSVLRYIEVINMHDGTLPVIDEGIPIPDTMRDGKYGKNRKYPVRDLEIGQSFFVPKEQMPSTGTNGVRIACSGQALRHGFEITTRKSGDGIRVWRTA